LVRCGVSFSTAWPGAAGCVQAGDAAPAGLDRADPAAALVAQALVVAQARDVDARFVRRLHDRLARIGGDLDAVDGEGEAGFLFGAAHWVKSLSKM
jgi:hypothetical protein